MSDETKVEETTNADGNSVSQPIAKPNVVCSQSPLNDNEKIQKAKDFIWQYMSDANKELIIDMATLSIHERHGLYVKRIFAEMDAKSENGYIIHEVMSIGFQYR